MKLRANAALSLKGRRQLCRRVLEGGMDGWRGGRGSCALGQ
jgi:hypothetical protein